ncbi:MAG TPA: DUF4411 family protein [Acidimicrobiia bacterium]|nr:DUF4411 family protein [Acidimicrobiia bacterium]
MAYLLDANVFIQAKNDHYPFAVVPAFWDWIDRENGNGQVFSVDRVRVELIAGSDELATWAQNHHGEFFIQPDPATVATLGTVSHWANGAGYDQAAVATFLNGADYYLVAEALAHGQQIVTHEASHPDARKRIPIPNACEALGINYQNPFQMLQAEGPRFILGP